MKKLSIFCVLGASMVIGTASAGEWADACRATLEGEGRDASGCDCLEEAIIDDEALIEEFAGLGEIADPAERFDSASDEAKAIMLSCTRS